MDAKAGTRALSWLQEEAPYWRLHSCKVPNVRPLARAVPHGQDGEAGFLKFLTFPAEKSFGLKTKGQMSTAAEATSCDPAELSEQVKPASKAEQNFVALSP